MASKKGTEGLERAKRAVALQRLIDGPTIAEPTIVEKDEPVPVAWLKDPSFWNPEQRQRIAKELLAYRNGK